MREILFRGKDIKTKELVEGYYAKSKLHWHKRGVHEDWIITSAFSNGGYFSVAGRYAVDKDTVCEYTGLKDKNGTKIFEGDICSDEFCIVKIICKKYGWYCEVIKGCILSVGLEFPLWQWDNCETNGYRNLEVIGNIHDNPELLKK